jgi:stage III sporulation protein AG
MEMDLKPILNNKWLLVLGLIGILFLVIGPTLSQMVSIVSHPTAALPSNQTDTSGNSTNAVTPLTSYENAYDKQLTQMLSKIEGIHHVAVMVTLDSTGSVEVANNTKTSTQTQTSGSTGKSTSTTSDTEVFTESNGSGNRVPYVVNRVTPQVRGVLVTVNANDFYVAKSEIIDAITNVLDVPAYKISVEPQKTSS